MCGILGTVNLPFDGPTLDLVRHRGPDGGGLVETRVGPHRIALGHRRLAIVELSAAGDQPMLTPDRQSTLVFNGEIYNHQVLRAQLPCVQFRGHSDTETLLHLLAREGTAALRGLNGIFALGMLDASRRRLLLARDPFGVKPLYYCQRGNSFAFGSELKPILELAGGALEPACLAELLRLRYLPAPDTLFAGIKKVRPGHVVTIDLTSAEIGVSESPYAALAVRPLRIPYREAVDEYARRFEQAVQRQLMSDVEMGVLLSGGVDSALVAWMAQKHSAHRLKAFTVGFTEQDESDEVAEAHDTAVRLGLDHRVVRIGSGDFFQLLRRCVTVVEEPLATTSLLPMHYLAQLASQEVKVVLTGQGADEPLGGYDRYQSELCRGILPPSVARVASPLARRFGLGRERLLRGLESLAQPRDLDRFLSVYTVFPPHQIARLIGREENRARERLCYWYELLESPSQRSSAARMMSLDLRMNLADDLLLYTDKITMSHSLECRVPMLDLELVRYLQSLPVHYRVRLARKKIVHKDFARSVLPPSIVQRRKRGFQSPTGTWLRRGAPLRALLLDRHSPFATHFDLGEVERVIAEHERGLNRERQLFLLACISYWMQDVMPLGSRAATG